MIEIRKLTKETFDLVKANCKDAVAPYVECPETGIEAWDGDQVIGVAGITDLWSGVGEAWMLLHRDVSGLTLCRAILKMFRSLSSDLRRVQITVRESWPEARKLAEHLGMTAEGVLKGYCPDCGNAIMYSRCK